MALRLMSPLPARIVQVLKDFLPAELDLIDAEEGGGVTTPDIEAADYYEWDQQAIANYPACSVRPVNAQPVEVRPDTFGQRIDAFYRLDVMFHANIESAKSDPLVLQKLIHRYIAGATRVLCVMKEGLQTSADPTRFVSIVEWVGEAFYGPEEEQLDGAVVRTGTLPIRVRVIEPRT